jgi:hypothetical protein
MADLRARVAPVTVRANEQFARRFLAGRVSAADLCGELGITAGEVNGFLMRECARVSSGSAGCCTYRLRSLLRYLALRGFADPDWRMRFPASRAGARRRSRSSRRGSRPASAAPPREARRRHPSRATAEPSAA